jgi:hypothetical protein
VIPASNELSHGPAPNANAAIRFGRGISPETPPEYEFIFSIKESAQARWHYTPKDAERTPTHMIENAFEVAKRSDQQKGLEIMIEGRDAHRQ